MKIMKEVEVTTLTGNDILGKNITDDKGNILIGENTVLGDRHIKYLKKHNITPVIIVVKQRISSIELNKIKKKYLTELNNKFMYFDEGNKKQSLIKMFLQQKMKQYYE